MSEPKPPRRTRRIRVDQLARVEGEGALRVTIEGDRVLEAQLSIFEPPRFFEAFLRGRLAAEAPDITARICGICPVAYQMSAVHAIERLAGVRVEGALRELRRLLYCGEWIESHTLHVYLLHAPDFLGYEGAVEMAADHPGVVERGLRLKKAGNAIMQILGGREIHPINVRLGGFYRVPRAREWDTLREELLWARDAAVETVRWTAGFDFPDLERDYELVALQSETEYPFNEGTIASNRGLAIDASEFEDHFEEQQVPHSNALHCVHREHGAYLVGPLARFALNAERLSPLAREVAREIGLETTCRNPFRSILVRGIEIVHACDEAVNILEAMPQPEEPAVEVPPVAGIGWAATEAPRGLLYHRYRTDEHGRIEEAHIVPPTSQNQKSIEDDLRDMIPGLLDADDALMRHRCEQAIRNYDPCISCATHFLRLEIERR